MNLMNLSKNRQIKIKEPFAEFLRASEEESFFNISLLDCYRLSGHACQAITGAYLVTERAIAELFPENICTRGDLRVSLGSKINERASGPRANVISYITGAWGETGFPGLRGRFTRKSLIDFDNPELNDNEIQFTRLSTGQSTILSYNPEIVLANFSHDKQFPESWRLEVAEVLAQSDKVILKKEANVKASNPSGH